MEHGRWKEDDGRCGRLGRDFSHQLDADMTTELRLDHTAYI